ncbi:MAG: hypothetical protein J5590_06245 [Clostridia bacterium]|nr:hypothetical protein [Clostridia bacterium]
MIDYINRLMKKRYILTVIIITLVFGLLGEMYNVLIVNRLKCMTIEFNYPGAERGLNPDGSMFEISDIKAPEVLEKAKANLKNNDIDTEFLRSRVTVLTKVTGQAMDKIVSDVHNEKNSIYMPTTFYVYYSQKNKFSKNESEVFMENLAKAYTEYFTEKYSEKNDVLDFKSGSYDFSGRDYLEIYTILKNKVDSMLSYVKSQQNENRAFYTEDKVNLGMAAKQIENFRDTSLENFYAFIVQNAISKNNYETVKRTDYLVFDNFLEYRKLSDASNISRDALGQYESAITAVAYIPSVDNKRNYYMSRTKTGLDTLTRQSYSDGIEAAKTLKDIEYYQSLFAKYSAAGQSSADVNAMADSMIDELSAELEDLSKSVIKIDDEYLQHKSMNYFRIRLPENNRLNVTLIIKFMILGFIIAMAVIVFKEFWKKGVSKRLKMMKKAFSSFKVVKGKR